MPIYSRFLTSPPMRNLCIPKAFYLEEFRRTLISDFSFEPDLEHFTITGVCSDCQPVPGEVERPGEILGRSVTGRV